MSLQNLGAIKDWQQDALGRIRIESRRARLEALFEDFHLDEAHAIIAESNSLRGHIKTYQEKGAVGEAVVAATMKHFFATFGVQGFVELQYDLWGANDRHPNRAFDVLFIRRTVRAGGGSVTFMIEAKNYEQVDVSKLTSGDLARQIEKDERMRNPRIEGRQPVIPVWWFLQGVDDDARCHLDGLGFQVIDFTREPFLSEMSNAFDVPAELR